MLLTPEEVYLREVNDFCNREVLCAMYEIMSPDARARTFLWFALHRCANVLSHTLIAGKARELRVEDGEGKDGYYHTVLGLCIEESIPQYDNTQLRGEYMRVFHVLSEYEDTQYSLVNRVRSIGWTPLIQACTYPAYKTVALLFYNGADPNVQGVHGSTALMWASLRNDVALAELLLRHGANPYLIDERGMTAYKHACTQKNGEMMTFLSQNT
jgi:hypothetical protein